MRVSHKVVLWRHTNAFDYCDVILMQMAGLTSVQLATCCVDWTTCIGKYLWFFKHYWTITVFIKVENKIKDSTKTESKAVQGIIQGSQGRIQRKVDLWWTTEKGGKNSITDNITTEVGWFMLYIQKLSKI